MRANIQGSGKPAFITEADLYSPCQGWYNPLMSNKDNNDDGVTASNSLRAFVMAEAGADYVIAWLLTDGLSDAAQCISMLVWMIRKLPGMKPTAITRGIAPGSPVGGLVLSETEKNSAMGD